MHEYKTGLDCLKEEMAARGCSKAQLTSKVVPIILDIVANSDNGMFTDLYSAELKLNRINIELERKKRELDGEILKLKSIKKDIEFLREKEWEEAPEYIQNFYRDIENIETAECRDKLKLAQFYINSVNVETKYDNTAFIVGLSALLTGVQIDSMEELRKINKKIKIPRSVGHVEFFYEMQEGKEVTARKRNYDCRR